MNNNVVKSNILLVFAMVTSMVFSQEDINLSTGPLFEGEPYIKANPDDPNHLVTAWMGFVNANENLKIKTRTSFDAGITWSPITNLEHVGTDYTSADPSIGFAPNGDVIIAYIDWTGSDVDILTGGIQISKSTNGGVSFNTPIEVVNLDVMLEQKIIDRPWIAIDRSATSTAGNIYITSMNAKDSEPEYHPYISISTDGGDSFIFKILDGDDWLSGDLITSPMPTPTVQNNGVFYAIFPSFVFSQNTLPQYIIASSNDGGLTFNYQTVFSSSTTFTDNNPLPKKGYLLREDPSDFNHLAFIFPSNQNEDLDIYFTETFDAGENWTPLSRINDDPIANDRMQDLMWGDFNEEGDLILAWRDRRNAPESGYETASEIWAAFRPAGTSTFEPNFQITDETVAYDDILALAGNDFMSVQLIGQAVHTVWGDTRTGTLKIWYQRSDTEGNILSKQDLASVSSNFMYPNPARDYITLRSQDWLTVTMYSSEGKKIEIIDNRSNNNGQTISVAHLAKGTYIFVVEASNGIYEQKVIIK